MYIRPDYYDDFRCIADKCRHSCCVGWEIDIDGESLRRFRQVPGALGEKLKRCIDTDGTPHFILDKDERCPFLKKSGLCELITELGEESLCDICTEHPRFYNEYGDVFEAGLGMCCEEAARLLLKGTKSVELIAEADGEEDTALPPILILREKIFDCLKRTDISFAEKERCALALVNAVPEKFRAGEAAWFCLTLERMEDAWGDMLRDMENRGESAEVFINTDAVRAERICEYFVFRHFAALSEAKDASVGLKFCFFAVYVVSCLEALGYGDEALRLFSAEIEYSDENVDKISEYLGRNRNV